MGSIFSFYIAYTLKSDGLNPLQLCVRVLFRIFFTLLVILMSSMDALPLHRKKKIVLGLIGSIAMTILAITVTVQFYEELEKRIIITDDVVISTYTLRNSAYRIVALFFWKQTIFSYFRKEKCILLKYTPYVKWIYPMDGSNELDDAINHDQLQKDAIDDDNEPQTFDYPQHGHKQSNPTEMREIEMNKFGEMQEEKALNESESMKDTNSTDEGSDTQPNSFKVSGQEFNGNLQTLDALADVDENSIRL